MRFFDITLLLALGSLNIVHLPGRVAAENWLVAALCFVVGCACFFMAGRISGRKPE